MAIFSKSTGYSGLKFCVGSILTHHYVFIDIIVVLVGRLSITNFVIKNKKRKDIFVSNSRCSRVRPPCISLGIPLLALGGGGRKAGPKC